MTMVGKTGTMTVASPGARRPGEVLLPSIGGSQTYIAYCTEEVPCGTLVVVYEERPGRAVAVEPVYKQQQGE
jgi:hypothetical protein